MKISTKEINAAAHSHARQVPFNLNTMKTKTKNPASNPIFEQWYVAIIGTPALIICCVAVFSLMQQTIDNEPVTALVMAVVIILFVMIRGLILWRGMARIINEYEQGRNEALRDLGKPEVKEQIKEEVL